MRSCKQLGMGLVVIALCGLACQTEEQEAGEMKGFGDPPEVQEKRDAGEAAKRAMAKRIGGCVKDVFYNREDTLSDGEDGTMPNHMNIPADLSLSHTVELNSTSGYTGIRGRGWIDEADDQFDKIKTDVETCECLRTHKMTVGVNEMGQVRVGLGNFSANAPSDRWTVEGGDAKQTIEIKRMPDFDGQKTPSYHYCRLKITVIPSDKKKPISEELELGGGERHDGVEALASPRPQGAGSAGSGG